MALTRQQAVEKAKQVFAMKQQSGRFPAQEWHGLDGWDMELYKDAKGQPHASLYPVEKNGQTDVFDETTIA